MHGEGVNDFDDQLAPRIAMPPRAGVLLIAQTSLLDPNFGRSVILLCEHSDEGTFGLVLNQRLDLGVRDLVDDIGWDAALHKGGPVQPNTLHFIHRDASLDIGSQEVLPGVYWGGSFDGLSDALASGQIAPDAVRFFVGYSGWGRGQLAGEIERDSWYLAAATPPLVFCEDPRNHWRLVFREMGPEYALLAHFPDDARLN
jgi:putative transcriptional regulator